MKNKRNFDRWIMETDIQKIKKELHYLSYNEENIIINSGILY